MEIKKKVKAVGIIHLICIRINDHSAFFSRYLFIRIIAASALTTVWL